MSQACSYVHRLRSGLHDIDRKTVMGMIRIPRLAQRKASQPGGEDLLFAADLGARR